MPVSFLSTIWVVGVMYTGFCSLRPSGSGQRNVFFILAIGFFPYFFQVFSREPLAIGVLCVCVNKLIVFVCNSHAWPCMQLPATLVVLTP